MRTILACLLLLGTTQVAALFSYVDLVTYKDSAISMLFEANSETQLTDVLVEEKIYRFCTKPRKPQVDILYRRKTTEEDEFCLKSSEYAECASEIFPITVIANSQVIFLIPNPGKIVKDKLPLQVIFAEVGDNREMFEGYLVTSNQTDYDEMALFIRNKRKNPETSSKFRSGMILEKWEVEKHIKANCRIYETLEKSITLRPKKTDDEIGDELIGLVAERMASTKQMTRSTTPTTPTTTTTSTTTNKKLNQVAVVNNSSSSGMAIFLIFIVIGIICGGMLLYRRHQKNIQHMNIGMVGFSAATQQVIINVPDTYNLIQNDQEHP